MIDLPRSDENTWVMPDDWRGARHPRRDRPGVPAPVAPDPDDAERAGELMAAAGEEIERIFALPGTEQEIADAGRAYLRGEPDPLGAAAVAWTICVPKPGYGAGSVESKVFVAAWCADRGLAFAAAAFTAMADLVLERDRSSKDLTGLRWRRRRDYGHVWWLSGSTPEWLRANLAAAPDEVYEAAVESLGEQRRHPGAKLVASYLVPTREDWVEEVCGATLPSLDTHWNWLLMCALGRPHQAASAPSPGWYYWRLHYVATLVEGVGPDAAAPAIASALDGKPAHGSNCTCHTLVGDDRRFLVDILATLPADGAFQALAERVDDAYVEPGLLVATHRFPARAMRLLPRSPSARATELLEMHVRRHRDLAESVLPTLPAESRKVLEEILGANRRLPEATDLPVLLTEPPWTRAQPKPAASVPRPGVRAIAWASGEREEWQAKAQATWDARGYRIDFAECAENFGSIHPHTEGIVLVYGPEDLVCPLLKGWKARDVHRAGDYVGPLLARFELDAHDAVLSAVRRDPAGLGRYVTPLLSDELARSMAEWLTRQDTREMACAWFGRHGLTAVPCLLPYALGKAGPARRAAEQALRHIADTHGPQPIVEAARSHGDGAAAAVEAILIAGPLAVLPKKIPSVDWVDLTVLPRILARDRKHALPDDAVRHVLTMLAMSKPGEVYAGVPIVRDLCDPASLALFGWAVFRWWEMCGAKAKDNWALTQLAFTGDDGTVRRLTPLIRAWPGESGHAKAVTGLDVLAAIGTETALMHLHGISQRVKFRALKDRANAKIREIAAALGLTGEQLADRLVPDFGLDASGTLTLDYGPRRFVIAFDEQLRPTVADEDGKLRKSLPKPGAKDDPDLAPAAYKRFSALKKDVRTAASGQVHRLETAMAEGRRWPLPEFRAYLAGHPLLRRLVVRLVWLAEHGGTTTPFRVGEDATYSDVNDETLTFPDTTRVRVAHPLHLGDALDAWSSLFADYEIIQPFPQLGRITHTLTAAERTGRRLERFEGGAVPVHALLGLERHGWRRGAPMDAGFQRDLHRDLPCGRSVTIELEPGIAIGNVDDNGDQQLKEIRLNDTAQTFADLDPVTLSELLGDLVHLTESARP